VAQTAIFGINSNLDTGGIIDNLTSLQRSPITIVEAKRALEDAKLLSFQDLRDRLQTFKGVVNTLNTESRFLSTKADFSNNNSTDTNSVISLSSNSQASSGTYSLTVSNLAKESKLVSAGFSSTSGAVTQGVINIVTGTASAAITIDSTNNTADGLRLAINNSGLDVNAKFLNDGSSTNPLRLVLSGTKTGTDNVVAIKPSSKTTSSYLFGTGIKNSSEVGTNLVDFTEIQSAQNANFLIDGIAVSKSTNVVSDVIDGTIITLDSTGSGSVTLSSDSDAIKDKVQAYIDGYNELASHLTSELSLETETGETGVLFANFTIQNLQQKLRETITTQILGVTGDFSYLSQIGIRTVSDGTLTLNEGDFTDALAANVSNISQLFSSSSATTSSAITFIGFTNNTLPGSYNIRVQNGIPQLATSGSTTFTDTVGSGNFYAGAEGTDAEGLNFRISSLNDGDYGKLNLSIGVAQITNRILANLTDASLNGPLEAEIDSATETIKDFDETIVQMEERVVIFEETLKQRFTNLEVILGRLNSQRDSFNQSIAGIQALSKSK
jgi:flagellar hook-associated protein 2